MADTPKKKTTKLPPVDATPQPTKTKKPEVVVLPQRLYVRFQIAPGESVDAAIRAQGSIEWRVSQVLPKYIGEERFDRYVAGLYHDSGVVADGDVVQVPIPVSELGGTNPIYVSIAWDASDPKIPIWTDYLVQFAAFDDKEHPLYRLVALGYVRPYRDDRAITKAFSTKSAPPKKGAPLRGASMVEEQAILQFQADHGLLFNGALGSKGCEALKKASGG